MNATLDWPALCADLDRARARRGMSWAAVSAAAGVPSATVWRLARGEVIAASVLLPLMAWAQLDDVRAYVRRGGPARRPLPASVWDKPRGPSLTITLTLDAALVTAIETRARVRAQLAWQERPSRSAIMRELLIYGLRYMPAGWQLSESGAGVIRTARPNRHAHQDQDDPPDQAAAQQLHNAQHDEYRRENPQDNGHAADHKR